MRLAIALLFLLPQENPLADALKKVDEETLKAHEKVLASDEFEGRAAGFPGNDKAVEYIVKEVKEFGLKPAGEGDGYTQEFTVGKDRKCRNVIALLERVGPATRVASPGAEKTLVSSGPAELAVIGPEGGLTSEEEAALVGKGAARVSLGPHLLRIETAAVAAAATMAQL